MRVKCLCFNFLPEYDKSSLVGFQNFCSNNLIIFSDRINKRGSQKDMEQKKKGNYFFYDDGADAEVDDDDDFDDI